MKKRLLLLFFIAILAGCTTPIEQPAPVKDNRFAEHVADAKLLFETNVELGITEEQYALPLENISYEATNGIITKITKTIEPIPTDVVTLREPLALDDLHTLRWTIENDTVTALHITRNSETLKQHVYAMPFKERVGHLIVAGFEGTTVTPALQQAVEEHFISNVILFSKNITSDAQLRDFTTQFHALAHNEPLSLSIDEEGGNVSRLPNELASIPTAATLAQRYSVDEVQQIAQHIGKALAAYGIHVDFAPVMDVNSNPNNPVIGTRSFSSNPQTAADYALAFHRGLLAANITTSAKHFPGHGDTDVDSHLALPVLQQSRQELEQTELIPFRRAIEANVPMIMVGHLLVPALDAQYPASLSKKVMTDLLRNELGYSGIIITDDVTMQALDLPIENIAVQTIAAGADIVLVGHDLQKALAAQQAIIAAVKSGELSEQRVNNSVLRVLREKRKRGEANVQHFSVKDWNDTLQQLLQ